MPPHSFRLEKSSGFCHPASIPTRPSFLGCHNWRQISGVLEGRWRFTESLVPKRLRIAPSGELCYHPASFTTFPEERPGRLASFPQASFRPSQKSLGKVEENLGIF